MKKVSSIRISLMVDDRHVAGEDIKILSTPAKCTLDVDGEIFVCEYMISDPTADTQEGDPLSGAATNPERK